MFDAHRHLGENDFSSDALYCTSKREEWQSLQLLHYPAVGCAGALGDTPLPAVETLYAFLRDRPSCHVGEVGLDKRFPDIAQQVKFLSSVLDLAFELDRSVTLHIVQSEGKALDLLKSLGKRLPRLLWHGFTGSLETAKEADRLGCILSLGPLVERTRLGKNLSSLSSLPLAIETDYEGKDSEEYSRLLENQYRNIARLLDIQVEALIRKGYECKSILTDIKAPR
jgi:TatD DNase family protein